MLPCDPVLEVLACRCPRLDDDCVSEAAPVLCDEEVVVCEAPLDAADLAAAGRVARPARLHLHVEVVGTLELVADAAARARDELPVDVPPSVAGDGEINRL